MAHNTKTPTLARARARKHTHTHKHPHTQAHTHTPTPAHLHARAHTHSASLPCLSRSRNGALGQSAKAARPSRPGRARMGRSRHVRPPGQVTVRGRAGHCAVVAVTADCGPLFRGEWPARRTGTRIAVTRRRSRAWHGDSDFKKTLVAPQSERLPSRAVGPAASAHGLAAGHVTMSARPSGTAARRPLKEGGERLRPSAAKAQPQIRAGSV
jgi:hypothetical protein